MVKKTEPVAYIIRGCYVCLACARNVPRPPGHRVYSPSERPVYRDELPETVWCRGCEDQITVPKPDADAPAVDVQNIQDSVAHRIRAELVCCDIYERVQRDAVKAEQEGTPHTYGVQTAIGRAILRRDWHDLCYWGEASARIAEGRCPGYETLPNICRCTCEGCKSNCSAHIEEKK